MKVAFVYMNNQPHVGIGAGYVAGAIIEAGHSLTFFDTLFTSIDNVVKKIIKENYDILVISSMSMIFEETIRLIKAVKQQCRVPVLVGGIHPTIMGKQILEENKEIDYLCIGEGESFVVDFLKNFGKESLFNVKNLAYRRNGKIHINPTRPAEDLSKLPQFPWQIFNKEAVVDNRGFVIVSATRGCPYNCTYCCNSFYLKMYGSSYLRFSPIKKVISEIEYLKKNYSPKLFSFADEMILTNAKYAKELFRTLKKKINMPYGCMCRVEYISPEIIELFKETGCRYIAMGIECGDEGFRKKYLNRWMTNEQIIKAFKLVKDAGIFVTSFNIIGFPFKNDDQLTEETVKLNRIVNPNYAQFSAFYPLPGTILYKKCIDENLIDPVKNGSVLDYLEDSVLRNVSLSKKLKEINTLLNPRGFAFDNRQNMGSSIIYRKLFGNKVAHEVTKRIPLPLKIKIKKRFNLED